MVPNGISVSLETEYRRLGNPLRTSVDKIEVVGSFMTTNIILLNGYPYPWLILVESMKY